MAKIPFYLVTGFLGSGKTTLLKRYLEKYSDKKRIAIIQNEFAEVNIDTQELKNTGKSFEILEMNNGSVFCVCLLGDFIRSLHDFIVLHQPQVVILEASGLSDPISIGQILGAPPLSNHIWLAHTYTVVDALNFKKTVQLVKRNLHQIRTADTVIINKSDLVKSTLEIESEIKQINPFAGILQTSWCEVEFKEGSSFRPPAGLASTLNTEPSGRPDVDSIVIKTTRRISNDNFRLFIQNWCGESYRMKGFVNTDTGTVGLQKTFDQVHIKEMPEYSAPTQLVILGPELKERQLQKQFENLCTLK